MGMPKQNKNSEMLIKHFNAWFSVGDMSPEGGEFIADQYGVMCILDDLQDETTTDRNPYPIDWLHEDLLNFANSLLAKPREIFPLASMIVGYIAQQNCSRDNRRKIEEFFDRLEKKFDQSPDNLDIFMVWLETYFCAGRMLPFESESSRRIHHMVDTALGRLVENWQLQRGALECYVDLINSAENYAHIYPIGHSLLRVNFESLMSDIDKEMKRADFTQAPVDDILAKMTIISGTVAKYVPENSGLFSLALDRFTAAWDRLHHLAPQRALAILERCYEYEQGDTPNKHFIEIIRAKADVIRIASAGTQIRSAEEPMPTRPKASVGQGKLLSSTSPSVLMASVAALAPRR